MFHWICPECGLECPPSSRECPECDRLLTAPRDVEMLTAVAAAHAPAGPPELPTVAVEQAAAAVEEQPLEIHASHSEVLHGHQHNGHNHVEPAPESEIEVRPRWVPVALSGLSERIVEAPESEVAAVAVPVAEETRSEPVGVAENAVASTEVLSAEVVAADVLAATEALEIELAQAEVCGPLAEVSHDAAADSEEDLPVVSEAVSEEEPALLAAQETASEASLPVEDVESVPAEPVSESVCEVEASTAKNEVPSPVIDAHPIADSVPMLLLAAPVISEEPAASPALPELVLETLQPDLVTSDEELEAEFAALFGLTAESEVAPPLAEDTAAVVSLFTGDEHESPAETLAAAELHGTTIAETLESPALPDAPDAEQVEPALEEIAFEAPVAGIVPEAMVTESQSLEGAEETTLSEAVEELVESVPVAEEHIAQEAVEAASEIEPEPITGEAATAEAFAPPAVDFVEELTSIADEVAEPSVEVAEIPKLEAAETAEAAADATDVEFEKLFDEDAAATPVLEAAMVETTEPAVEEIQHDESAAQAIETEAAAVEATPAADAPAVNDDAQYPSSIDALVDETAADVAATELEVSVPEVLIATAQVSETEAAPLAEPALDATSEPEAVVPQPEYEAVGSASGSENILSLVEAVGTETISPRTVEAEVLTSPEMARPLTRETEAYSLATNETLRIPLALLPASLAAASMTVAERPTTLRRFEAETTPSERPSTLRRDGSAPPPAHGLPESNGHYWGEAPEQVEVPAEQIAGTPALDAPRAYEHSRFDTQRYGSPFYEQPKFVAPPFIDMTPRQIFPDEPNFAPLKTVELKPRKKDRAAAELAGLFALSSDPAPAPPAPKPAEISEPDMAGLQSTAAQVLPTIRPAQPDRQIFAPDAGLKMTLPSPALPRELIAREGLTVLSEKEKQKAARSGAPGWLVSVLVTLLVFGAGVAALFYFGPLEAFGGKQAPAPVSTTEAAPAATAGSHPLSKYVEITGVRIVVESSRKSEVHYLVVNHSSAEIADVTVRATVRNTRKANSAPVTAFSFRLPTLGPYESKEMIVPIEKLSRGFELPDWQNLKTEFQITGQ